MNRDENRESQLLEQAFSTGEMRRAPVGCPSEDELWASAAGELSPAADEAVILHLARCGECASIWRLAREILPEDHLSKPSVVSIDRRQRSKTWLRALLPAAAVVLVGVGLGAGLLLRSGPSSAPVFREQMGDTMISPAPGSDRLPRAACHLRWSRGPAGTRYDLVVTDGELTILADVKGLNEPQYTLPREKIPTSATELLWRVTARLPDGRTVASDTFTTVIVGA
jgi:hypothetical protein